jgi:hypothetical protein
MAAPVRERVLYRPRSKYMFTIMNCLTTGAGILKA